ncbi:hypothetical protein SS1G_00877 [Sclerotinia sclerotiorum 1980 UF-70]|uniref:Carboxylic ester hydrolase n=2 Tax=Sclerotinia sclerotiorum (strain ATCC 18683 / 1980 / Ss-1) TaxID=665079 RepID=A7E6F2_SCLS1|nr:hypothetical protein SS1G_00877 [Sclerotinia sclerotiorum 1980 UF-70]APA07608.1 hypothetical protein sscle_03g023780 [Sclerotinia sclerotiorum 1980 UF-70]EDN91474.1 hypothetical protein SS1G_00877 [Sclerotinia sclerotiorum 1980 UF-70]
MYLLGITTCLLVSLSSALPASEKRQTAPSVQLSNAQIIGSSNLTAGVDTFKGIPYAQPPVGPLRLKPPTPITTQLGTIQATSVPTACPQARSASPMGEDCLTINVQRPSNATKDSKLPVLFWIYGGAFGAGSTQTFDGTQLIQTSISRNQPFIYVAVNYRIGGFGFLGGSEIYKDGSANLGLLDQRLGLEWVADNIAAFGGDPDKVTIWGESAGSISVFDQMALYGGKYHYKNKPLFRGGIMDSGTLTPAEPIDGPRAQKSYGLVVAAAGCANSTDTLNCLRGLPYETYLAATVSLFSLPAYSVTSLPYLPRPDYEGGVFPASAEVLALRGQFAPVPIIVGDQEDEGTLFSRAASANNTAQLETLLHTVVYSSANASQISTLVSAYPDDPSFGSPFGTGSANNIFPEYKRLAAITGDISFTLIRRLFLEHAESIQPHVPKYSYLATYGYGTPTMGTAHGSDVPIVYGQTLGFPQQTIQSYYLNFVENGDPNVGPGSGNGTIHWPLWNKGKQLMNFGAENNTLIVENFREEQYQVIKSLIGSLHI